MKAIDNYYQWGEIITEKNVQIPRTTRFILATEKYPFARLMEIRKKNNEEALILDFQVDLPQNPKVLINRNEIVAIVISPNEDDIPQFLSLRCDFPQTSHQNLGQKGEPISLCLFEESYSEIRLRITENKLLERVSNWLSRAASEELHLSDQPLEPLLLTNARIIFNPEIFSSKDISATMIVGKYSDSPLILRAFSNTQFEKVGRRSDEKLSILIPIDVPPWHARTIEYSPQNLEQLCDLLKKLGFSLQELLIKKINNFKVEKNWKEFLQMMFILLLRLPKTRKVDGDIETTEYWAFLCSSTIEELSIKLGLIGKMESSIGMLLGEPIPENLDSLQIFPMKPTFSLSKQFAMELSNNTETVKNIIAVGLGALGSQVVLNLARQGFGTWHLVDNDNLLPHNLSRHGLSFLFEGENKANALAIEINRLLNDENVANFYPFDLLHLENSIQNPEINKQLSESELILDFSTSRAVLSFLADSQLIAQRVCCYINSTGTYMILMAEGVLRKVTIDDLDKQFFARVLDTPELKGFISEKPLTVSYSASCRDTSVVIPQDTLGIFSGIASKYIKTKFRNDDPSIMVWKIIDTDYRIESFSIPISPIKKYIIGDWQVHIPIQLINNIKRNRDTHLPNETGGVLIGSFDNNKKVIYIVSFLQSPKDSIEWPTSYIRGVENLTDNIAEITRNTGNELCYVGEWHSHPHGCSNKPSNDDLIAHNYLIKQMGFEGLPGVMLIFSDDADPNILFGQE